MNILNNILLMAPSDGEGGGMSTLIMFGLIIVVMYFFMIRPQSKKAKELNKFRAGLDKGDKIITAGGIHGRIAEVKETTVIIETEGGHKLKVEKTSVSMDNASRLDEKK